MAVVADYQSGTVTVGAGSTSVVGVGTAWATIPVAPGDLFMRAGYAVPIDSVTDDTHLTLAEAWPGAALAGSAYRIRFQDAGSRYTAAARALIEQLSNGLWLAPDATGTLADRAQFDGKPRGFIFMRTDVNPFLVYVKKTDTSGDWSAGTSVVGPQGPQGIQGTPGTAGAAATIAVGDTTTGEAGTSALVSNSGTSSAAVFNFTIPRGGNGWTAELAPIADGLSRIVLQVVDFIGGTGDPPSGLGMYLGPDGFVLTAAEAINIKGSQGPQGPTGVTFRGAWDSGTDYAPNDLVIDDDVAAEPAIWIALTANTNAQPKDNAADWAFFPGSFATANDYGLFTDPITETRDYGTFAA